MVGGIEWVLEALDWPRAAARRPARVCRVEAGDRLPRQEQRAERWVGRRAGPVFAA